jgi:hypothetical protein
MKSSINIFVSYITTLKLGCIYMPNYQPDTTEDVIYEVVGLSTHTDHYKQKHISECLLKDVKTGRMLRTSDSYNSGVLRNMKKIFNAEVIVYRGYYKIPTTHLKITNAYRLRSHNIEYLSQSVDS